jgi:predicted nucleic acid-binding Zn ribbon protein
MPLYEYECSNGHIEEHLYFRFEDSPEEQRCPWCASYGKRKIGLPSFNLGWVPVVNDSKSVWEGTPLDGTDGINRLHYKSDKIFVDQNRRTQQGGASKKRRGMAAVLAGDAA